MSVTISENPRFIEANYKEIYTEHIITIENRPGKQIYQGLGVGIDEHPLKKSCMMDEACENCKSKNVEVIYASWQLHYGTGDAYVSYELHCLDCGKYISVCWQD
jgi:hypothetical protein